MRRGNLSHLICHYEESVFFPQQLENLILSHWRHPEASYSEAVRISSFIQISLFFSSR